MNPWIQALAVLLAFITLWVVFICLTYYASHGGRGLPSLARGRFRQAELKHEREPLAIEPAPAPHRGNCVDRPCSPECAAAVADLKGQAGRALKAAGGSRDRNCLTDPCSPECAAAVAKAHELLRVNYGAVAHELVSWAVQGGAVQGGAVKDGGEQEPAVPASQAG